MTDLNKLHTTTNLIPVTKWSDHHAWPPIGGLRHLIFHAESNGFDKAIKRIGRRVLIDEAVFFEWVEEQNGSSIFRYTTLSA